LVTSRGIEPGCETLQLCAKSGFMKRREKKISLLIFATEQK
jgi:hypothetical protein